VRDEDAVLGEHAVQRKRLVVIVVAGQPRQGEAAPRTRLLQLVQPSRGQTPVAGMAHLGRVAVEPELVGRLEEGGQMPRFQRRKAEVQVGQDDRHGGKRGGWGAAGVRLHYPARRPRLSGALEPEIQDATPMSQFTSPAERRTMKGPVDYKNGDELRRMMTGNGKILGRKRLSLSATEQKQLTLAIKRARHLALLPFTNAAN